jgi:hypothetical protein
LLINHYWLCLSITRRHLHPMALAKGLLFHSSIPGCSPVHERDIVLPTSNESCARTAQARKHMLCFSTRTAKARRRNNGRSYASAVA